MLDLWLCVDLVCLHVCCVSYFVDLGLICYLDWLFAIGVGSICYVCVGFDLGLGVVWLVVLLGGWLMVGTLGRVFGVLD